MAVDLFLDLDKSIPEQLDKIAYELMNRQELRCNGSSYRITELEFYIYHSDAHPDPYVHKHKQQKTNGQWYFHGSGLDITMGNAEEGLYGGVLIRGLFSVENKKFTDGPLNAVTSLFSNFGSVENQQWEFGLRGCNDRENEVRKYYRIGLNSLNDLSGQYHDAHYRYVTDIENTKHKYKDKMRFQEKAAEVRG